MSEGDHSTPEWLRHDEVTRNPAGLGYTHLVRASEDPQRRGANKEAGRGWSGYALQRQLNKGCPGDFIDPLLTLLEDGVPRTFNRMCVELLDVTADFAFQTPFEGALDELFCRQDVQMSIGIPIYWHLTPAEQLRPQILKTRDGQQGDLFS